VSRGSAHEAARTRALVVVAALFALVAAVRHLARVVGAP
jgi:hypothetical protein